MSRDVFQRLFEKLKKFFNTPLSILEYFPSSTCWGVHGVQKKLGLKSPLYAFGRRNCNRRNYNKRYEYGTKIRRK
jgi:hypothetical protein